MGVKQNHSGSESGHQSGHQSGQDDSADDVRLSRQSDAGAGADAAAPTEPVFDAGDFNSVYAAWYGDVTRWLRALGGPPADLDDLAQEVFIVVHRRLHAFDGKNLAGWLYRIAIRQLRDLRRLRWVKNVFKRTVPLSTRIAATGPTPVMALETKQKQDLLDRLLTKLSGPLRETFILFEIEGYTSDQIAAFHGVSVNTVRARIHRSRKRVLKLMADWRNDERERGDG
ncbi:MAG TPA: RNA polymerase sigma factor [Polyangia bacterium]|nr:RNA polymerase sigma factor [Polyangia bacterium]